MKKIVALILSLCLAMSMLAFASADAETKTGSAQGFASEVKVEMTVEDGKITALTVDDSGETYPSAGIDRAASVEKLIEAILASGSPEGVDVSTGATFTSKAIMEAIADAAFSGVEVKAPELSFTAGDYEATAYGYNGNVTAKVTFSDTALTAIEVTSSMETGHVGTDAFSIMIPEMIEANGSGVDSVSGATFTSRALREIVNAAAEDAGCSNLAVFKANKIEHTASAPIEKTGGRAGFSSSCRRRRSGARDADRP